ncbi:hypothetical protein I312_102811 [Cryptococcus bacillisporus CA1280]|uniref:uncharacterized protein n=1 Tax=Cryptococcus bacillisporus CA1280 TaxID=1296109 RepID=UPI003368A8F7
MYKFCRVVERSRDICVHRNSVAETYETLVNGCPDLRAFHIPPNKSRSFPLSCFMSISGLFSALCPFYAPKGPASPPSSAMSLSATHPLATLSSSCVFPWHSSPDSPHEFARSSKTRLTSYS